MARLVVIYDDCVRQCREPMQVSSPVPGAFSAHLDVADDLSSVDIYDVARRVAALLLEQLPDES